MRKRNETHEKRSREDEKAAKRAAKGMRPPAQAVTASATAATLVAPADDNRLEVRIFNGNAAGGADIVIGINSTVGTTGGPAGWPIPPQMTFVDDRSNGLTIGGKNGVDSQDAEAAKDGRLSSFVRSPTCENERDSSFLVMQKLLIYINQLSLRRVPIMWPANERTNSYLRRARSRGPRTNELSRWPEVFAQMEPEPSIP